jgi:mannobiose 2-epimerase
MALKLKKEFQNKKPDLIVIKPSKNNEAHPVPESEMHSSFQRFKMEMENELKRILSWWMQISLDEKNGGFYGKIDHSNKAYPKAPKGAVLNSRILWAFSSAYTLTGEKKYLRIAERAFTYFTKYFIDKEYGGVFWTVDFKGKPLDSKKQIYALAFAVYGLSEYYHASKNENAKRAAIEIYHAIIKYSHDKEFGGYIEALTKDWQQIDDLRLSEKDANEKKSMNTHLHLLEAFTNLYRYWKNEILRERIVELIKIFLQHIIDTKKHHLILFFDERWTPKSKIISYGHDIEAAWLIREAAEVIDDEILLKDVKEVSLQIAKATITGLDKDGGLFYEYDPLHDHLNTQKHSWPQAEAMIGFFNTWQLTGDEKFLKRSMQSWEFVKRYMLDKDLGEWYWGVNAEYSPMKLEEKAGIWKCPYHNSRACIEIINRINNVIC